jgi:beta-lactamase regulating signal transducer with metallopeptidase domain
MIAAWMLYCSLCAFGLTIGAVLAERALLRGRGPVRVVWIGAVFLSLLVPAIALRFAPRPAAYYTLTIGADEVMADPAFVQIQKQPTSEKVVSNWVARDWRKTIDRLNEPLLVAWITLSIAVAFNFFGGVLVLAWMRRRWQRREVLGVPVYVSERTGPAVVGAVSPAIVVPQWVLALEPAQLALMLRHEEEHRHAGDGRLLTMAQLALIVMPWNLAMWWQIFRLRVAVELDCDARVLRAADARSYGDLLLEFARPRRAPSLVGVTAFAERAAQLERRIRLLSRHRARTPRAASALATSIAIVALTVAWVAPRPPVPARAQATPTDAGRIVPEQQTTSPIPAVIAPAPPPKPPVQPPAAPPKPAARAVVPPCGGAANKVDARLSDVVFDKLFDGIALSDTQAAKACAILVRLEQQQATQDVSAAGTMQAMQARAQTLRLQRDSVLRALVTTEADRATLDARLAGNAPGGRGRSAGSGVDGAAGGRRGGGAGTDLQLPGARQGGRGARGGGAGPEILAAEVNNLMVDMMFHRYFDGITLSAEQETAARAMIAQTQEQIRTETRPAAPVIRVDNFSGLIRMSDASAAELSALLSSDADRAMLQARIVSLPAR